MLRGGGRNCTRGSQKHVYKGGARNRSTLLWTLPFSRFPSQVTVRNRCPTACLNKAFIPHTPHAGHFVTPATEGSATHAGEKLQHAEKEGCCRALGSATVLFEEPEVLQLNCQVPKEKCLLHRFPTRRAAASVGNGALLNSTFSRQRNLADGMQRGTWVAAVNAENSGW